MYGCCDFGKERREERMRGDEEGMTPAKPRMYLISSSDVSKLEYHSPYGWGADIAERVRSNPYTQIPLPLKVCFGKFHDCPCDDECSVSLYCMKYANDVFGSVVPHRRSQDGV